MQRFAGFVSVTLLSYFCFVGVTFAQTKIYIENQTDVELRIANISVHGDKVSKKAWKKGVKSIAPGKRKSILLLKRSGKSNWMDPTPRFVEPDKTVTFHAEIVAAGLPADKSITLLQKLYGEGKTTKMWYAIDAVNEPVIWEPDYKEYTHRWVTPGKVIKVVFKAYKDGKKTHVEYVFAYL